MSKKAIAIVVIFSIFCLAVYYSYFFLENIIYERKSAGFVGDCGHFVVWLAANAAGKDIGLAELSYQINPLVIMTGPMVVRNNLAKFGLESRFYNDFSIKKIKQKLDEGKKVIAVVNVNLPFSISSFVGSGATHYVFITHYDRAGFYFFDAYYYARQVYETDELEPYFMSFEEFEEARENVKNPGQIIGRIQDIVGFRNFVMVLGESGPDNLRSLTKAGLFIEYVLEKTIEIVGRIIVVISPRLR